MEKELGNLNLGIFELGQARLVIFLAQFDRLGELRN